MMLNIGSGQLPFPKPWINIDTQARWNPDIVADGASLPMIQDGEASIIVLHHVLEHFGCGEAAGLIRECHRLLESGGNLLVFVPNMAALVDKWRTGELSTQVFLTNVYGAYMGDEADRHKWGYDRDSLMTHLGACAKWSKVRLFDWREIEGASIARDNWILGVQCVK